MSADESAIAESSGAPSYAADTSCVHMRDDDILRGAAPLFPLKSAPRSGSVAGGSGSVDGGGGGGGIDIHSLSLENPADVFLRRADPSLQPGNVNTHSHSHTPSPSVSVSPSAGWHVRSDAAVSAACAISRRTAPTTTTATTATTANTTNTANTAISTIGTIGTNSSSSSAAAAAAGPMSVPSEYDTAVRALLVAAERELAASRELAARRGAEADALRATLTRDRAIYEAHEAQCRATEASLRAEHTEDVARLREQVVALTQVAEAAMAERARGAEEAARRKAQLLALLDREREEKSHIMADYRQQTESLIAEQGREITALRTELRALRAAHEQMLVERTERDEAEQRLQNERIVTEQRLQNELSAQREEAAVRSSQLERRCERLSAELQRAECEAERERESNGERREAERRQMDGVLHALRADAAAALDLKAKAAEAADKAERECERLREALTAAEKETEEVRARLREEMGAREEAVSEMHGTVRVLTARLASHDDDTQRLQEEIGEANAKLHDAHTLLGKKDAAIGQLTARLRAYESRMGPL